MMVRTAAIANAVAGVLVLVALVAGGVFGWLVRRAPNAPRAQALPGQELPWPEGVEIPAELWQVFQAPAEQSQLAQAGPLASRYRLAGTFFLYANEGADAESNNRRAIVDDLRKGQQTILQEGDLLDEFLVAQVFPERILLRAGGIDYELNLSFADAEQPAAAASASAGAQPELDMEDMPALETNRFGKRVGENRWVVQREELLKYYREVLDEPQRMAAIYMSLKPDYQENEIMGYRLGTEGEGEFFKAAGLRENDVIRKVNSMQMKSQRRAEYFLSEFLKDRVNALVLDIEREGKPEKLIYLIR